MRRLTFHIAFLFTLFGVEISYSQSCAKVGEAIKSFQAKDLEGAKKAIDLASADETCGADPATWYYKAFFNKDYYRSKESHQKNSSSRNLAIEAAKKNMELDPKNKYAEECKKIINFLSISYYNDAASDLNGQKYQAAHDNYVRYIETVKYAQIAKTDTMAIFYAGYTAFMANNYSKAKEYLTKARDLKYNEVNVYYYLGKVYLATGEKDKAYNVLDAGTKLFPGNKDLILTQVNLYIEDGKLKELEKTLDKAIQVDPHNHDLKLTLAIVCERLSDNERSEANKYFDKAERLYKELIKLQPSNFRPNFNLAVMYYNKAINLIENTDMDQGIPEIDKVQEKCIPIFKQSLPYMQRAHEIDPKRKEVLEGLAGIYFALNDLPKSNEYKQKAEAVK